jgi:hypothetical protein
MGCKMSAKAKRFRQHFGELRPLGPADCFRANYLGKCATCGTSTQPIHIPTRLVEGQFCRFCCAACNAAATVPPAAA